MSAMDWVGLWAALQVIVGVLALAIVGGGLLVVGAMVFWDWLSRP